MNISNALFYRYMVTAILCSLCSLSVNVVSAQNIQKKIDRILQAKCLNKNKTAIHVIRVADGKSIYERDINKPLLPASTQKVVTTAAALHYLGPEYRYRTELRHTGRLQGEVLTGNLILRGSGDPKIHTSALWEIARSLYRTGVREIQGDLIADAHVFDAYDRAPSWKTERTQRPYDASIGALSLNYNTISVHLQPSKMGKPVKAWLSPNPAYMTLNNKSKTVSKGKTQSIWAFRGRKVADTDPLSIFIKGNMPISAGRQTIKINVADPVRYTIESFRSLLLEMGITVKGNTLISQQMAEGYWLYTHISPPLSVILKELNTYSNNFMAEQIIKTIALKEMGAPASHEQGVELVKQFLQQANINTDGMVLTDGSGLSRKDRFTVKGMTDLMRYMAQRFDIGPDFFTAMRVMGASGAPSKRLKRSPAKGFIRGKTGTLNGVSTLVGYVASQQGELYSYAFFLNQNRCGYRGADQLEDKIIKTVYYGDKAPPATAPLVKILGASGAIPQVQVQPRMVTPTPTSSVAK